MTSTQPRPLRVLLVEDNAADGVLLVRELERLGYEVTHGRVQSDAALREALVQRPWDLVLSDYVLPGYSGLEALATVRAVDRDLPFVIVSGAIDEELAAEALRTGAQDFMLKGRFTRLPGVIERVLRDAHQRGLHDASETARQEARRDQLHAELASQAKSEFLSSMSHEIRTPLNAIMGFSELLEQEVAGPLNAEQREFVLSVVEAGRNLVGLIDEILGLARVEARRVELCRVPTSLHTLMAAVRDHVLAAATTANVRMEVDIAPTLPLLDGDPGQLQQLLANVVTQAIRSTPRGQAVHITAVSRASSMIVSVRDTGAGLSAEELRRVFRPFERMPGAPGSTRGTGIGLALARRLAELHGGTLEVTSTPGVGTTFIATLPVAA